MPDREKVIDWLRLCDGHAIHTGHGCEKCPYLVGTESGEECVERLHADSLALLKAQESENILAGAAWVVSYWDEGEKEATITVFNNKEAGDACFKAFLGAYDHVQIDEAPVYKTIIVDGEEYGEKRE